MGVESMNDIRTTMRTVILASTSPYRRQLLERLGLRFQTADPAVDETPIPGELPEALARRLAHAKAAAVARAYPQALIIGSDQVAVVAGEILGKPGGHEQAVRQLQRLSGRSVDFLTALCLLNSATRRVQHALVPATVVFRHLNDAQIDHYLSREPAYNCAGGFKSEGLGIGLLEKISSDDPTALIGLPLISLTSMLAQEGVQII